MASQSQSQSQHPNNPNNPQQSPQPQRTIPTLSSLPNFQRLEEEKIDVSMLKIPASSYVPEEPREDRAQKHCDQIYENLCDQVSHSFFKESKNKDQIMAQLKQQIDYIYARRYGKKRIG